MQWVWEELRFRKSTFQVAHFEAPGAEARPNQTRELVDDQACLALERAEEELGACLWHETNDIALRFLERRRSSYAGLRVVELGAGAGACGLALAKDGAAAVITDLPPLLPLLQLNVERNFDAADAEPAEASAAAKSRAKKKKVGKKKRGDDSDDDWVKGPNDGGGGGYGHELPEDVNTARKRPSAKARQAARQAQRTAKSQPSDAAEVDALREKHVAGKKELEDGSAHDLEASECAAIDDTTEPCVAEGIVSELVETVSEIAPVVAGCTAQGVDWLAEQASPTLPTQCFDIVIVVDCLYENKFSWDALEAVMLATSSHEADIILVSATLRRPFLDEFVLRLEKTGFVVLDREVVELAATVVLRRPP